MSAVHRLSVATDLESYSTGGPHGHHRLQRELFDALDAALSAALGDRASDCFRQPRGDGELTVLPAAIDERTVLRVLLRELADALERANGVFRPENAIRMRIGLDSGNVALGRGGVTGDSPIHAFRLCDSPPLREALAATSGHYAVMVSDQLYQDVVAPAFLGDQGWTFRSVAVAVKTYRATGWLHVPGERRSAPERADARQAEPEGGLI